MIRFPTAAVVVIAALALAACSAEAEDDAAMTPGGDGPIRIMLDEEARTTLPPKRVLPPNRDMPGAIDPPAARWRVAKDASAAAYAEPGKRPLLVLACSNGTISAIRPVADRDGAKAVLAFVGYRGILRLRVQNDGGAWIGSLPADDPHWRAVTGGPFYATVAGGGKVITPGPGDAIRMFEECEAPETERLVPSA
ncbi:hypothetical protein [Croceicoccus hydrothermalis]|uniref:hypothetical protein n=1 Tax=Croceicoccus hydrothermalis TaxID=2867964 RepID=UPI001EFA2BF4|nr:hypothetical protein [Croceicoccus hydrothermalis]